MLPAAAVGAVIVLVVGVVVEAYYLADVLVRDASRSNPTSSTASVWLVAGVAAGLVFGVAGGWAPETSGRSHPSLSASTKGGAPEYTGPVHS